MFMKKQIQYDRRLFLTDLSKMAVLGTITIAGCGNADLVEKENPTERPGTKDYLPDWQEGYLDIHHIATGRGDSTFIICPDGTTLLIDAGDGSSGSNIIPAIPNDSKSAGEWINDYIGHFSKVLKNPNTLDYVWLTHFHGDHIGHRNANAPVANGYILSGITMVGERITIKKIIDRGWPNYDFPSRSAVVSNSGYFLDDYLKFAEYQRTAKQTVIEGFIAGSDKQFILKNYPASYPDFNIRNLCVNGKVWTGQGNGTKTLFTASDQPDENMMSGAIKLTYGSFKYFSGGDISGANHAQYPSKVRDIETPVGEVTGAVNVLKTNHHAWIDTTNANFLCALKPQAMVIPVWHYEHPHPATLARMVDKLVYPGDRSIFVTGFSEGNKNKLGSAANVFKPAGHVVVRVYNGGNKYKMFVLDPATANYPILYSSNDIVI